MTTATNSNGSQPICTLNHKFFTACLAGLLLTTCGQPAESTASYTDGPASSAGTGRYYMAREIAEVMSYRGADWLERAERSQLERTDLVLENLPLDPASVVADIGAGSGYFSRRIAPLVPDGKVIAVDIQPEMLALIKDKAAAEPDPRPPPRVRILSHSFPADIHRTIRPVPNRSLRHVSACPRRQPTARRIARRSPHSGRLTPFARTSSSAC